MNTTTPLIQFLNKHKIKWFPINVKFYKDENGKVKLHQATNLTAAGAVSGGFWGTHESSLSRPGRKGSRRRGGMSAVRWTGEHFAGGGREMRGRKDSTCLVAEFHCSPAVASARRTSSSWHMMWLACSALGGSGGLVREFARGYESASIHLRRPCAGCLSSRVPSEAKGDVWHA